MWFLTDNNQANIVEACSSTSRYLDDLLNIDNPNFKQIVKQIYPTELQSDKPNSFDTEALFGLGLVHNKWHNLSNIYDILDDFDF